MGRGIGLGFLLAGLFGLTVTLLTRRSRAARMLSAQHGEPASQPASP